MKKINGINDKSHTESRIVVIDFLSRWSHSMFSYTNAFVAGALPIPTHTPIKSQYASNYPRVQGYCELIRFGENLWGSYLRNPGESQTCIYRSL